MAVLNSDERNLILVQALYFLADALAGIFVTIFIFSHSDFATTLLYTGINFCGLLLWYIFSGRMMEKISSGTMVRIGLALNAFFYLCLFLLRDNAVHYIIPLGFLDGTAAGIFWAGLNLNQYAYSQKHTRVHYFGMQGVMNNGVRAAGPIIGGALITWLGKNIFIGMSTAYAILFLITSLVYFSAAVFIGKLPQHELLTFSYRKFFTHKRSASWNQVLWQHVIFGSFDVLMGTTIGVLIFIVVKSELLLGSVQTVSAVIAVFGSLIAVRLLKRTNHGFWIGSIGEAIGIIMFAVMPDIRGLVIFIIILGITGPFLSTWLLTVWFHTLDREKLDWKNNFHVLIERDIALGFPRILSYLVLILIVRNGNQVQLAWKTLYILPVFPILLGVLFSASKLKEPEILP